MMGYVAAGMHPIPFTSHLETRYHDDVRKRLLEDGIHGITSLSQA